VGVRGVERGAERPWLLRLLLMSVAVVWLPFVFGDCFGHQPLQKSLGWPAAVNENFSQRVNTQVLLFPIVA